MFFKYGHKCEKRDCYVSTNHFNNFIFLTFVFIISFSCYSLSLSLSVTSWSISCYFCNLLFGIPFSPNQWNSTFLTLTLIIECTTEKGSQCMKLLSSFAAKLILLINKNVFFQHCRQVKTVKNLYNCIWFVFKQLLCVPFQCCPL